MKRLLCAAVALACLLTSPLYAQDDDGFVPLFDGKTLSGWDGNEKFWRVEDGVLIGQTTPDVTTKKNTFLIYKEKEFSDFDLRFSYKVDGGNSGIQYRSELIGDWFVKGMQADFEDKIHKGKDSFSGMYFEENGRMFMGQRGDAVIVRTGKENPAKKPDVEIIGSVGDREELEKVIKRDDWNEYRIVARGPMSMHIINGRVMSIGIDEDKTNHRSSGIIAWQLHAGPPLKIQMKDIRIKELK